MTYQRNLKIPAILLICLGISAASLAQPMEKPVAQSSFPVNIKAVARDLNLPSFSADITPTSDSNKLLVTIANPDRKKLRISLTSPSNGEVYNKATDLEKYRTQFDFSLAEDGIYTLVIAEGRKKLRKQININSYREAVTRKMEVLEAE